MITEKTAESPIVVLIRNDRGDQARIKNKKFPSEVMTRVRQETTRREQRKMLILVKLIEKRRNYLKPPISLKGIRFPLRDGS